MAKIVLEAKNINKSYSNGENHLTVLENFSLSVFEGDIVTIMGQSGSGKSTALNILGTLDFPNSGSLKIGEKEIHTLNEKKISSIRNKEIGFVFQFHHLLTEFSAFENALMPAWIAGYNKQDYATELFERMGLIDRMTHLPNQLSGGERSRVAVIRALINSPKILLADEPTGNLDEKNAEKLIDLLSEINRDLNQSIILTTHNPGVAKFGNKKYELENRSLIKIP